MFIFVLFGFPLISSPDTFAAIVTKCNRQNKMAFLSGDTQILSAAPKNTQAKKDDIEFQTIYVFSPFLYSSFILFNFKVLLSHSQA